VHNDKAAQAELDALGLEVLPVVILPDGRSLVVGHVAQLREFLGMPPEEGKPWHELVDAAERALMAFELLLTQVPDEKITLPTPNRGRDMRNMTVNIFSLMQELIVCMDTGHFSYAAHKDHDKVSVNFTKASELIAYAQDLRQRWAKRAREVAPDEIDAFVSTDRKGDLTQYLVLDAGARHAAGHLMQAYQFMRDQDIEPAEPLTREDLKPIQVQESLY
jgi:hypothetical protein